jgi:hypothetical protein
VIVINKTKIKEISGIFSDIKIKSGKQSKKIGEILIAMKNEKVTSITSRII